MPWNTSFEINGKNKIILSNYEHLMSLFIDNLHLTLNTIRNFVYAHLSKKTVTNSISRPSM